jgi:hypothetical protein
MGEENKKTGPLILFIVVAVIGLAFYGLAFLDARVNPWTLWRSEWRQYDEWTVKQAGRFYSQKDCVEEQWKKLNEELERQKRTQKFLGAKLTSPHGKSIFIREGKTIFAFGESMYIRYPKSQESFFDLIDKYQDLNLHQKEAAKRDALLPEIDGTWTYFCTPTTPNMYWPFYTPKSYPANRDLQRLGERMLARIAAKMLAEPEKQPFSEPSKPKLTDEQQKHLKTNAPTDQKLTDMLNDAEQ